MININSDLILKHLKIPYNLLESYSLKDIFCMEEQANMMEETEIFENNMLNKADFTKMFRSYDAFCNLFGEEYVDRYLLRYRLSSITEEYAIHDACHLERYEPYIFIKEAWKDVIIYPARKRTTRKLCKIILKPSQYQNLRHEPIIRKIILEKYPWMQAFNKAIYNVENEMSLFFIHVENNKCLYVPWRYFIDGNIEGIIETQLKHGTGVSVEDSEITKQLFNYLKGGVDKMTMEKYAVDMAELPVTDDQIRELRKLAGSEYKMPKNRQEADEMIEKLAGEQ